jgi:hypothetical protein
MISQLLADRRKLIGCNRRWSMTSRNKDQSSDFGMRISTAKGEELGHKARTVNVRNRRFYRVKVNKGYLGEMQKAGGRAHMSAE